jgi:hypothetical protein
VVQFGVHLSPSVSGTLFSIGTTLAAEVVRQGGIGDRGFEGGELVVLLNIFFACSSSLLFYRPKKGYN